jgi:hypothetical protein
MMRIIDVYRDHSDGNIYGVFADDMGQPTNQLLMFVDEDNIRPASAENVVRTLKSFVKCFNEEEARKPCEEQSPPQP